MPIKPNDYGDYFDRSKSWRQRLDAWIAASPAPPREFLRGNKGAIVRCLEHEESGLRMVVNIGADALLSFLRDGAYANAYDLPVVAGKRRGPSAARQYVDRTLGLDVPANYFFGAASMGGVGIRFYGEYCLVLRPERLPTDTRVFDRNSYDILFPPLAGSAGLAQIVEALRGTWPADAVTMLVLRVLPALATVPRLVTLGAVSDLVLHDEDFLEVQKEGTFGPRDLEEVRETPEDQAIEGHILGELAQGGQCRAEEFVWIRRRQRLAEELRSRRMRSRIVATSGRGSRWD